ncbi:MAG: hypothetical protein PHT07_24290 [Paludibacter sp.]|nr:hypothetical protein [Paludibacter sp.]
MKLFRRTAYDEKGQILLLSLVILVVGFLVMTPLLSFMSTNVKSTTMYQGKMKQSYACDAGIEDATFKVIKNVPEVQNLDEGDTWTYQLSSVNGLPVTVTVTKWSMLDGLLGSDEYRPDRTHESWMNFQVPTGEVTRNYEEDWVEYTCILGFDYTGCSGNRKIQSIGVYFAPSPGVIEMVNGPYDEIATPVITFENLVSTQTKAAAGGFAFIYRWEESKGPEFNGSNTTGSLAFKFKVFDADWSYTSSFIWATVLSNDVGYVTNSQLNRWLIQASSGQTTAKVEALEDDENGTVTFLSWERN